MNAKLALSLAVSALIVAIGGFFAVLSRLDALAAAEAEKSTGRPPGVVTTPLPTAPQGPDTRAKLDHLIEQIEGLDGDAYDYFMDLGKDLFDLKREVRQLKVTLKQVVQGLGTGPGGLQIGWGLKPRGTALDEATAKAYREEARTFDIGVEEGRVTVRGFLNFSPKVEMPIEYFMTRYPQAGHETLVHLIGGQDLAALAGNPYGGLKGLATALYKGLLAAGFQQGEPTHPDPTSDPKNPRWVLATGDTVYIGVRYEREGKEHLALATDWILDPQVGTVLPLDAFRFTGSARGEDPDTGDDVLAAEMMGLLVSVWPNAAALAEVALESSLRNDYAYNFSRIPKQEGEDPLYLEVILSKTPIEPLGEGAAQIERPPPIGEKGGR